MKAFIVYFFDKRLTFYGCGVLLVMIKRFHFEEED